MNAEDSRSRFNRRRIVTRLRRWRPVVIALLVAGVAGACGWAVFVSSWLAATDVSVAGETTLSRRDVVAAARVSMGTPLARLDLDRISQRVAGLPAVRSVTVHRSWPHTVSISIIERQPVAAVQRGGEWWVIDSAGVVFRDTGTRAKGLPVISMRRSSGPDALREAATVAAALPADLLAGAKRLTAVSMDSITLRMKDKSAVIWGSSAESDRKVEVLKALLVHGKARVYDVSVPEQPTTTN